MTLVDIFIVLGVFFFFAYIIFAKMHKNNPELIDKIKSWLEKKEQPKVVPDQYNQVWHEKRELI